MRSVADELERAGAVREATRLRDCGVRAAVRGCSDCGEAIAHAQVTVSCDLRICPFCARTRGLDRAELLTAALLRVPALVDAQAPATLAAIEDELSERERIAALWSEREGRARERYESAGTAHGRASASRSIERSSRLREAAELQCAELRFDRARVREAIAGRWSWKLITVSPQWDPQSEHAYGVDGLSERAADAWARWERVRERYAAAGLSAAVASIECSDRGHVHVHAIVYGPWVHPEHAAAIAGCIVDVRAIEAQSTKREARQGRGSRGKNQGKRARELEVDRASEFALAGAVREAVKYLAKVPSVLRSEWTGGRSALVIHPRLAASWLLSQRGAKGSRSYGTARAAIAAERELRDATERVEREPSCRACGSLQLDKPRFEATYDLARRLGLAWGAVLSLRRQIPDSARESHELNCD